MSGRIYCHLVIAFIVLLSGCKHTPTVRKMYVDESLFSVIEVDLGDLKQNAESNISEIATGVEYIPLETREDCLIGEIKKLFVIGGSYCIVDGITESILIFNADGTFSHKIDRRGRGPGEYARISYATVDRNSKDIYIYSDINQAVFRYSWQGQFTERIPTPLNVSSLDMDDDKILFYAGRSWNGTFYRSSFPKQFRYIVLQNNESLF